MHDPMVLPPNLPLPVDDGAGALVTDPTNLELPSTGGPVNLAQLGPGRHLVYIYPRTGKPGVDNLPGWDDIPGARGCTPESCAFRDHAAELAALGVDVYGLSAQPLDDQRELAERLHLTYPVISDERLQLAETMRLPTFEVAGCRLFKRLTLVLNGSSVEHVFYPVFPPDGHAADVAEWLRVASPV